MASSVGERSDGGIVEAGGIVGSELAMNASASNSARPMANPLCRVTSFFIASLRDGAESVP